MFKTLSKEIGEYKKDTIMTPLFMVGEVAMECLIPAVMAILIDHMYTESVTMVIRYGAILIVLALVSLYCGASSARAGARAGAGFAKNLRKDLFYHVQEFSFKDIDDFSSSSLVTRLTSDVSSVQNAFQMIIRMAVRAPLMLIFSIVMASVFGDRLISDLPHGTSDLPSYLQEIRCLEQFRSGKRLRHPRCEILCSGRLRDRKVQQGIGRCQNQLRQSRTHRRLEQSVNDAGDVYGHAVGLLPRRKDDR